MSKEVVSKLLITKNISELDAKIKDGSLTHDEILTYFSDDFATLIKQNYREIVLNNCKKYYYNPNFLVSNLKHESLEGFKCNVKDLVIYIRDEVTLLFKDIPPFFSFYEDLAEELPTITGLKGVFIWTLDYNNFDVVLLGNKMLYRVNYHRLPKNVSGLIVSKMTLEDFLNKAYGI